MEEENGADIATYIRAAFKGAKAFPESEEIQQELLNRADGVFQWIVLETSRVLQREQEGMRSLLETIRKVPLELKGLYDDILRSLDDPSDCALALRLAQWITFAMEPLSLEELRYAVATDADVRLRSINDCEQSIYWYPNNDAIASVLHRLLQGLATVPKGYGHVQFSHESVREYMHERGIFLLEEKLNPGIQIDKVLGRAQYMLFEPCIRHMMTSDYYRMYLESHQGPDGSDESDDIDDTEYIDDFDGPGHPYLGPLSIYATYNWESHSKAAEDQGLSLGKLVEMTNWPSNGVWVRWREVIETRIRGIERRLLCKNKTLQHVAARLGLYSILNHLKDMCSGSEHQDLHSGKLKLLPSLERLDVRDEDEWTPLHFAAHCGQEAIVKLLLDSGKVDVDARNKKRITPLILAAESGHKDVMKLLLDTGKVNVDAKNLVGDTPLFIAVRTGNKALLQLLLDTTKVDVGARDEYYSHTPLILAVKKGHKAVIKLLLDTGKVNVDARNRELEMPLVLAAKYGHEAVVKLLLDTGKVNVEAREMYYNRTPLILAAGYGHKAVVKLLLDIGRADVNALDWSGRTASFHSPNEAVARLLLNTGRVDLGARSYSGQTLLRWAINSPFKTVQKQLEEHGARP